MREYRITRWYTYFSGRPRAVSVYRALRDITCAGCDGTIPTGSRFTWHQRGMHDAPLKGNSERPPTLAYCRVCWPFRIAGGSSSSGIGDKDKPDEVIAVKLSGGRACFIARYGQCYECSDCGQEHDGADLKAGRVKLCKCLKAKL